jgi:hypothetical protein
MGMSWTTQLPHAKVSEAMYRFARTRSPITFGFLMISVLGTSVLAQANAETEMKVTLFGQPCVLRGPLDLAQLKAIHSISPEQVYPPITEVYTPEPTRKALEKLKKSEPTPPALDRYREKLKARLEAQLELLNALENSKKLKETAPMIAAAKAHLQAKRLKDFEMIVAKAGPSPKQEQLDQLFENYNEGIEPDPEEEFHKAIRKINVHYVCSFEEESE